MAHWWWRVAVHPSHLRPPHPLASPGQRAGSLGAVAVGSDFLVFSTAAVGPDFFEAVVEQRIAENRAAAARLDRLAEVRQGLFCASRCRRRRCYRRRRCRCRRRRRRRRRRRLAVSPALTTPLPSPQAKLHVLHSFGVVSDPDGHAQKVLSAAVRLQCSYRRRVARLRALALALATYELVADPGEPVFYYNKATGTSVWRKPKVLGEAEPARVQ